MSVRAGGSTEKKQVPLWAAVVAGVVVLALVVWLGMKNFGPAPPPQASPEAVARETRWKEWVKRTGGDMSKLTPEEQQQYAKEAGPFAMKIWEGLKKQAK